MKLKVKFIDSTVANRKQVKKGDIVELDKQEAIFLMNIKKAALFKVEEVPQKEKLVEEPIEEKQSPAEAEEKPIKSKKGK